LETRFSRIPLANRRLQPSTTPGTLPVGQFSVMRFRGERPNLYQSTDGGWRLRFDPSDFKNEKGAAFEEYDAAVEPSVWPWIRR
ncbi:hypothetical protein, partial [Burkholderia contaminans]|uniref:hypothetical protein n=1 Tax=Burkholderia contaminans TaxID=488447 RepID=UPI001C2E5132